ncbi:MULTISPECIES: carbon storage regulator CsrA [Bacillaceae]|uniref:carbon storage regulator CsrA n=1 Tax=Bacillaceae TaxID=186817 RepID=UPI002A0C66F1|nr:carbon storage regulator CsrA [Cytobacillus sp. IB215316]MDX8361200.1 carbon storage regulator CsrA [Cytobacillus sp. IB215316]
MLVLTRKVDEAIQIGEDIEVTVLAIDREQIKLGIKAPKKTEIHRKEIYLSIQQENIESALNSKDILQQLNKTLKNSSNQLS